MKFIKYIVIGIVILLCSCNKEQIAPSVYGDKAIEFGKNYIVTTKGGSITDDEGANPLLSSAVFAYYTATNDFATIEASATPNLMYNVELKRKDKNSSWSYSPKAYWPSNNGHKVSFFAYTPYDIGAHNGAEDKGSPTIKYTIPMDVANQKDILWAHNLNQLNTASSQPVDLTFIHALTKITFSAKVKSDASDNILSITKIEVKDIYTTGTGKLPYISNGTISWSVSNVANREVSTTSGLIANNNLLTSKPKHISTDNGAMFMIPQKLPENTKIAITTHNNITNKSETREVDLTAPKNEWQAGYALHYTFTLDDVNTDIKFQVIDWNNQDSDANIQGSYLNIFEKNVCIYLGEGAKIYYSTNYPDNQVTATYSNSSIKDKHIALQKGSNCFIFPNNLETGDYIVTIKAGDSLTRKIKVKVWVETYI